MSTVAPRRPHPSLLDRLAEPPEGLAGALEHAGLDDLSAPSAEVLERLLGQDGPWSVLTQAL